MGITTFRRQLGCHLGSFFVRQASLTADRNQQDVHILQGFRLGLGEGVTEIAQMTDFEALDFDEVRRVVSPIGHPWRRPERFWHQ
jgi:hypothetical protein